MSDTQTVNEYLWRFGYAFAPSVLAIEDLTDAWDGPVAADGDAIPCPDAVRDLPEDNPARVEMLRLAQEWRRFDYQLAGTMAYGRAVSADGKEGAATFAMVEMPRCGCPDFAPPQAKGGGFQSIGSGPWKGCHGIGDFHAAHVRFTKSPPNHLNGAFNGERTIFQEALRRVRESYRKIGLLLYFSGEGLRVENNPFAPPVGASVQSNASFTSSSSGWIGLAIVGNNGMSCSSNAIWAQFLSGFASSSSVESKVHAWHLLLAHEFGHNCGLGHTSGGIMNPSLNTGSDGQWTGDVAESWMRGRFGGVAVPDSNPPGPGPDDPDDPDPPTPPDDGDTPTWLKVIVWIIRALLDYATKEQKQQAAKVLLAELEARQ